MTPMSRTTVAGLAALLLILAAALMLVVRPVVVSESPLQHRQDPRAVALHWMQFRVMLRPRICSPYAARLKMKAIPFCGRKNHGLSGF